MSKDKISDYSATANSNTDIAGINIDEGCAPSGINNAIRTLMKQLKDWQSGSQDVYITPAGSVSAPAITTTGDTNTGVYFPAADTVAVATGGTERVRIDNSGRFGVATTGTATPAAYQNTNGYIQNGRSGWAYVVDDSANTHLVHNVIFNGTSNTYAGNGYAARMSIIDSDSSFRWYQAASGSTGGTASLSERMRIDSSGNLLVGDTTAGQTSGYGIKIAPAGDGANYPRISLVTAATTNGQNNGLSLYSVGAAAWRFYVGAGGTISATSTTITGISDQRLKENIRDLDDGLEKVMALQPRKFDWKEGKGQDIKNARGFIAQEFEEVFPDMIEEWLDPAPEGEEPYKAVNANLIPTLVKAIQEQQALITTLTERITALEQA